MESEHTPEPITLRLPASHDAAVRELAARERVSLSRAVGMLVSEALAARAREAR